MASVSFKRIQKELGEIRKDPPPNCSAGPVDDDNMFVWQAVLVGPPDTPYAGGFFTLDIEFPQNYPVEPPNVKFRTDIYHCNVYEDGRICMDILKEKWTSALTIGMVLLAISSMLEDPNPDSPARPSIAYKYKDDRIAHDEEARKWTRERAI